ncbi:hypothetical protein KCP73_15860 [Salmonella enterica subsp. enterica]|nr:hypothetical protein KCP73_15860 [Salmonella enterica subsp. enterica]
MPADSSTYSCAKARDGGILARRMPRIWGDVAVSSGGRCYFAESADACLPEELQAVKHVSGIMGSHEQNTESRYFALVVLSQPILKRCAVLPQARKRPLRRRRSLNSVTSHHDAA